MTKVNKAIFFLPQKTKHLQNASRKVSNGIQLENCGGALAPIVVDELIVSPYPIPYKGEVTVTVKATLKQDLTNNIRVIQCSF